MLKEMSYTVRDSGVILISLHTPILNVMGMKGESFRLAFGMMLIYLSLGIIRMGNWTQNDTFRAAGRKKMIVWCLRENDEARKFYEKMGGKAYLAHPSAYFAKVGSEEDPTNFLLMHAMGPNVAGVIGTAVCAGTFMAMFGVF